MLNIKKKGLYMKTQYDISKRKFIFIICLSILGATSFVLNSKNTPQKVITQELH